MSVEEMAKAMWDRTHDGSWENRGDGQDESRDIYLADAEIAFSKFVEPLRNQLVNVRRDAIEECAKRADNQARIPDNTAERRAHIYCAEAIARAIRALAEIDEQQKSAPALCAPHNSGERPPKSDPAGAGADTPSCTSAQGKQE